MLEGQPVVTKLDDDPEVRSSGLAVGDVIVTADGDVVTRPVDNRILNGISRTVVLDAIAAQGLLLAERPFTAAEAKAARARASAGDAGRPSCRGNLRCRPSSRQRAPYFRRWRS